MENRQLREKLTCVEEEKDKSLQEARVEAGLEINKLRREVETLKSENKRLLAVINKMSPGGEEVQSSDEGETEETPGAEEVQENEAIQQGDEESNRERKRGLINKIKTLFRK